MFHISFKLTKWGWHIYSCSLLYSLCLWVPQLIFENLLCLLNCFDRLVCFSNCEPDTKLIWCSILWRGGLSTWKLFGEDIIIILQKKGNRMGKKRIRMVIFQHIIHMCNKDQGLLFFNILHNILVPSQHHYLDLCFKIPPLFSYITLFYNPLLLLSYSSSSTISFFDIPHSLVKLKGGEEHIYDYSTKENTYWSFHHAWLNDCIATTFLERNDSFVW